MILAVSGHRDVGYDPEMQEILTWLAVNEIGRLNPDRVLHGGALGWDMACARAAHKLRIPYEVFVPCRGQDARWSSDDRNRYRRMLALAHRVHVLSDEPYSPYLMHARNAAMLKSADRLLVLYDGREGGGTAAMVRGAKHNGVECDNAWERWQALFSDGDGSAEVAPQGPKLY